MAEALRICLFDAVGLQGPSFRDPFEDLGELEIVGEASTWDEMRAWIPKADVALAAINLDDEQNAGINAVERIARVAPECGIIGVSGRTDPAHIIGAMRAGCSQFVPWPIDIEDLRQAVSRLRPARGAGRSRSKRICIIGSSGGVGATTIACNLAMELGQLAGRQSALVDMNLEFGDIACAFDCSPSYSIADVCGDGVDMDDLVLSKAMHELPCNVSILARPERIEDAHTVVPESVPTMLGAMSEMYPFVVIDLPRIFSFLSAAAVTDADRILVVTQLSVACIRNAARIYGCLTQMGANEESIEIVLNRCKASFERITPDEVAAHFKRPIFGLVPNDYRRVQMALDLGNPVMADAPNSPARLAIQEMAKKLGNDEYSSRPATPPPSTGLLSKFWKRSAKAST